MAATRSCDSGCIPTGIHSHPTTLHPEPCARCGWWHGHSDPNVRDVCARLATTARCTGNTTTCHVPGCAREGCQDPAPLFTEAGKPVPYPTGQVA